MLLNVWNGCAAVVARGSKANPVSSMVNEIIGALAEMSVLLLRC